MAGRRGTPAWSGLTGWDDVPLRISFSVEHARLVLSGDIDDATYSGLTAALSAAADVPGDIHVDLGGVQFCDIAGLRALVLLAGAHGPSPDLPDRRVLLHTLPAHLQTVLRILGWDGVPGLVID